MRLKWGNPWRNNAHLDVDYKEEKVSELAEKVFRARKEMTEKEYKEWIKKAF